MNINTLQKEITGAFQKQLKKILKEISDDYKIDFDELDEKYLVLLEKQKKKRKKRNHILTGYQYFLGDAKVADQIREEHGDKIAFGEISKLKSQLWRGLTKEEKDRFTFFARNNTKDTKDDEYEIKTE